MRLAKLPAAFLAFSVAALALSTSACALDSADDDVPEEVEESSDAVVASCTSKYQLASIAEHKKLATRWRQTAIKAATTPADTNLYRTDVPQIRVGDIAQLGLDEDGSYRFQFFANEAGAKVFRQSKGTFTLHRGKSAGRWVIAMKGDDGVCRIRTIRQASTSGYDRAMSPKAWPFALEMATNGAWVHYAEMDGNTPCRWYRRTEKDDSDGFGWGCSKGYEGAF